MSHGRPLEEEIILKTDKAPNALDYTGDVINNIKVLERIQIQGSWNIKANKFVRKIKYKCSCLACGEVFIRNSLSCSKRTLRCNCQKWLKDKLAIKRSVYIDYKKTAEKRHLNFELDFNIFCNVIIQNCFYCNTEPKNKKYNTRHKHVFLHYNGIDRIDSSVGYTKDNIVTCCPDCNRAKWQMSVDEYKIFIKRVYNRLIERDVA